MTVILIEKIGDVSRKKKFEWFVSSMHCWYYSSQSYNSNPRIAKDISLGTAQGGDAFFIIVNNKIFNMNNSIDDINDSLKQGDIFSSYTD